MRRAFESRSPGSRLLIRYETMRERTAETLAEICEMLGLDGAAAERIAESHRFERLPWSARGARRAVRAARPGSWRENLCRPEQEAMHEALGKALEEFGYESAPSEPAIAAAS